MANWLSSYGPNKFRITIPRFISNNYFSEYELLIQFPNNIHWKITRRYSDFLNLNDDLVSFDSKFKVFFPPKKFIKNTSETFLNQRRKLLEMYINDVISKINNYLPRPLAAFLEMDKYEIHGITTNLAKILFKHGDTLLSSNKTFEISVLMIYAINERLISAAPTNIYNKPNEDFGNVLEVIESTKSVKITPQCDSIQGQNLSVGTSNIKIETLTFDISIFGGATTIELNSIEISNLRGLYKMNAIVETLQVHYCLKYVEDILFGDLVYRSSSFDDLLNFDGPWRCATTVDFSRNSIASLDRSIVTLKQVSKLNMSHNQISDIKYLNYLTFLTVLDLSYNNLFMCQEVSFSNKLGSIKKLILRGNKLNKLTLVDRMFSLEYLDISDNNISDFSAFLPFCRLSCLENLLFKKNPICYNAEFQVVLYDIFLDQLNLISINGLHFSDLIPQMQEQISNRRILKESILCDCHTSRQNLTLSDNSSELSNSHDDPNLLLSLCLDVTEVSNNESILNIPDMFNVIIYWFYSATRTTVIPSKLLWCTEIFSPNRCSTVLLISSSSLNASILKCSVRTSFSGTKRVLKIKPNYFIDLNKNLKFLVVGADKLFVRFDMTYGNKSLYLVNNPLSIDSFMGHIYHIDDEIVPFGDSRLIFLNEEDRISALKTFIDMWSRDRIVNLKKSNSNNKINEYPINKQKSMDQDFESEILFNSRAMLHMKNGFRLLLTIVVTRQMMFLVDERIFDWPDFNKRNSFIDQGSGSFSSPLMSLTNRFQFLQINAYFFHEIKSCSKQSSSNIDHVLAELCPSFSSALQITFNTVNSNDTELIHLYFESENKAHGICQLINQLSENQECSLSTDIIFIQPVVSKHQTSAELCSSLKWLNPSFHEIRLSLSLFCPKLSIVAQSSPEEIVAFCQAKNEIAESTKIVGIVWTKFLFRQFDSTEQNHIKHEMTGLMCLSFNSIGVVYETEEPTIQELECCSDPESDQPDAYNNPTILQTISLPLDDVFQIYVGMHNQWVTLCTRINETSSESSRLVLVFRNSDLSKQFLNWLRLLFKEKSMDDIFTDRLKYSNESNVDELLYQIRKTSKCEEVHLIHYTSVEDVRFESKSIHKSSIDSNSNDSFTFAFAISSSNIAIIRHNVVEYPVRHFSEEAVRQSPRNLQFHVITVIPLYQCLQLQLPGHDKNLLIILIQSRNRGNSSGSVGAGSSGSGSGLSTYKIQLSISSQKEQKILIDKLRQQWSKCLQVEIPLRVIVC